MKLTIGMATIEDYDGPYFTIQALRAYHQQGLDLEFIVVDNKPDSKASQPLKNFLEYWAKARYIPMPTPEGTSQTRNRVFQEATGDAVLCIDSHVLLMPGAIRNLINFYEANPGCNDLLTGPMLADDLRTPNTHFDDVWRAEMWGIWGRAWGCSGHKTELSPANAFSPSGSKYHVPCPQNFSILPTPDGPRPATLQPNPEFVDACPLCHTTFPKELTPAALAAAGYQDLAYGVQPFEIPGQGLGLFSCRKSAWLGFNEHFRGFGGEEMYIHEKYRKAGHKNLCLPFLKWGHRFGRPYGIPYVPTLWHKVRNYVLGHLELGLPLDRVHEHFVANKRMSEDQWQVILKNPIESGNIRLNVVKPERPQPRAGVVTPTELIAFCKENPRDLNEHLDKLYELSNQCNHVTEFTHRRESTVGLLGAKQIVSYQAEFDDLLKRMQHLFPQLKLNPWNVNNPLNSIEETDMLFLDTVGTYPRLFGELNAYHQSVRRWIVIHDTQLYREKGEDGGYGMLKALRDFMSKFPEWSIIYHTPNQYGLTVISKFAADKPPLPSTLTLAANFTKAMSEYVASGMEQASKEEVTGRLEICSSCEQRSGNRCAVCGCGLAAKARMKVMECPLGRWPKLEPVS